MTTITEFLLARIAEDEADARAAIDARHHAAWRLDGMGVYTVDGHDLDSIVEWINHQEAAPHIARHDPARALAECEAKRRIVEQAFAHAATMDGEWCVHDAEEIRAGRCPGERPDDLVLLRILAAVYANHSDFREEWR